MGRFWHDFGNDFAIRTVRPSRPSVPSIPSVRPVRPSRPFLPSVRQSRSSVPSVRHVRPSRPSVPSVRPVRPSRQSVPSVRPIRPSRPSVPSIRPVRPSRPSVPSVRPVHPSRPSVRRQIIRLSGQTASQTRPADRLHAKCTESGRAKKYTASKIKQPLQSLGRTLPRLKQRGEGFFLNFDSWVRQKETNPLGTSLEDGTNKKEKIRMIQF